MTANFLPADIVMEILDYFHHDCPRLCGSPFASVLNTKSWSAASKFHHSVLIERNCAIESRCGFSSGLCTIYSLCLINRYYNQVVTPILYKYLIISSTRRCSLLLRTLHSNPVLGTYTVSIGMLSTCADDPKGPGLPSVGPYGSKTSLKTYKAPSIEETYLERRFPPEVLALGSEMVKDVGSEFGTSRGLNMMFLVRPTRSAKEPWLWAWMMLYCFPNLQHLVLAVEYNDNLPNELAQKWFGTTIPHFNSAPRCISNLKTITHRTNPFRLDIPTPNADSAQLALMLLCSPQLFRLSLEGTRLRCSLTSGFEATGDYNLEILELNQCLVETVFLIKIFQRAPNLRTINFESIDLGRYRQSKDPWSWSSAISLLKSNLQDLTITVKSMRGVHEIERPFDWIGDLSGFCNLKRVELDWRLWTMPQGLAAVSSSEYLPVQLDRLRIVVDVAVFKVDDVFWRPLEKYTSYAQEDYQRELHGSEVPTFRLGPPKLSGTGAVIYQRPVPIGQSDQ